jgi:methanogenic corrinoid protein MtbC1
VKAHADGSPGGSPELLADTDESETQLTRLVSTIEGEIIPRLMLAHRAGVDSLPDTIADTSTFNAEDVEEFARLVLTHDADIALSFVRAIRQRGASMENVFLNLLAPSARQLGEWWNADLCDFTEVTLGLLRLHQILHAVSPAFESEVEHRGMGPRAMLVPTPGEQHLFGISMVVEFFRRAGWDVCDEPVATSDDLFALVRGEWFDVVGLSLSCGTRIDGLARIIHGIRQKSRNRDIGVLVGGKAFLENPDAVALVGADAMAHDGRMAVIQAQNILGLLAIRGR